MQSALRLFHLAVVFEIRVLKNLAISLTGYAKVSCKLDIAVYNNITVSGIKFDGVASPAGQFCTTQCTAGSAKEVNDKIAGFCVGCSVLVSLLTSHVSVALSHSVE